MIRAVRITPVAARATAAVLGLSPAAADSQPLPGTTMESVIANAKRLNAALRFKVEFQAKHPEMDRLAGGSL